MNSLEGRTDKKRVSDLCFLFIANILWPTLPNVHGLLDHSHIYWTNKEKTNRTPHLHFLHILGRWSKQYLLWFYFIFAQSSLNLDFTQCLLSSVRDLVMIDGCSHHSFLASYLKIIGYKRRFNFEARNSFWVSVKLAEHTVIFFLALSNDT